MNNKKKEVNNINCDNLWKLFFSCKYKNKDNCTKELLQFTICKEEELNVYFNKKK